jgi:hypothetical protein
LIDFAFFVDILVNFRTSFFNPLSGEEIFEPKEIASNYLKTRFIIDILATVPFDLIGSVRTIIHPRQYFLEIMMFHYSNYLDF